MVTKLPVPEYERCWFCDGTGIEKSIQGKAIICAKCNGEGTLVKYHRKRFNKRESYKLHKYTKLTASQLTRLEQYGGNGARARFSANGEVSLELIRRVEIAKRKQPKYLLFSDYPGRRVYIADRDLVHIPDGSKPLTFDVAQALKFVEGFDDEDTKKQYYSKLIGHPFLTQTLQRHVHTTN